MASAAPQSKSRGNSLRVFCPYARSLSSEEIADMSSGEREKAEAGDEGVWLEVQCPDQKCLIGEHKIKLEVRGIEPREQEGVWHKLFCPEDRCLAQSAIDLP